MVGSIWIIVSINLSDFVIINIHPIINNTKPNPAFVINTGEFAKRFKSFLIKDLVILDVFTI